LFINIKLSLADCWRSKTVDNGYGFELRNRYDGFNDSGFGFKTGVTVLMIAVLVSKPM